MVVTDLSALAVLSGGPGTTNGPASPPRVRWNRTIRAHRAHPQPRCEAPRAIGRRPRCAGLSRRRKPQRPQGAPTDFHRASRSRQPPPAALGPGPHGASPPPLHAHPGGPSSRGSTDDGECDGRGEHRAAPRAHPLQRSASSPKQITSRGRTTNGRLWGAGASPQPSPTGGRARVLIPSWTSRPLGPEQCHPSAGEPHPPAPSKGLIPLCTRPDRVKWSVFVQFRTSCAPPSITCTNEPRGNQWLPSQTEQRPATP